MAEAVEKPEEPLYPSVEFNLSTYGQPEFKLEGDLRLPQEPVVGKDKTPLVDTTSTYFGEMLQAPAADYQAVFDKAASAHKSVFDSKKLEDAKSALLTPLQGAPERVKASQDALTRTYDSQGFGEMYTDLLKENMPPVPRQGMIDTANLVFKGSENTSEVVRNIIRDEHITDALTGVKLLDRVFRAIDLQIGFPLLNRLRDGTWDAIIQTGKNLSNNELRMEALRAARPSDEMLANDPWVGPKWAADIAVIALTGGTSKNTKDWAQHFTLTPYDDALPIEYGEAFGHLLDKGDLSDKFIASMVSRHGENWGIRMASWAAREGMMDAATLLAASVYPPVALTLFPSAASRMAAARDVVGRVVESIALRQTPYAAAYRVGAMSATGAATEVAFQQMSGDLEGLSTTDRLNNLKEEFIGRLIGNAAGESLVAAVGLGIKAVKGVAQEVVEKTKLEFSIASITRMINDRGFRTLPYKDIAKLMDIDNPSLAVFPMEVRAMLHGYNRQYVALASRISDDLAVVGPTANMQAIREEVSKLTGIPDTLLEVKLAFGSEKYADNTVFKDIGRGAEVKAVSDKLEGVNAKVTALEITARRLENLRAKQELAQAALKTQVGKDAAQHKINATNARIAELKTKGSELIIEQRALEKQVADNSNLFVSTGDRLVDNMIMGKALGPMVMGKHATAQRAIQDIFHTYVDMGGLQSWAPPVVVGKDVKGVARITTAIRDAMFLKDPSRLGINAVHADKLFADAKRGTYFNAFEKAVYELPFKGVTRQEAAVVWNTLDEGAAKGVVFNMDQLFAKGLNSKQVDAYYSLRGAADRLFHINDSMATWKLVNQGYRSYDNTVVEVITTPGSVAGKNFGNDLTAEEVKQGYVLAKSLRMKHGDKEFTSKVHKDELKDITSFLDYEPGYVPIVYKDANVHVTVLNAKTGAVERIGAFKNQRQALNFIDNVTNGRPVREGHTVAYNPSTDIIMYNTWNNIQGVNQIGINMRGLKLYEAITPADREALNNALKGTGFTEENLRIILDQVTGVGLQKNHWAPRATQRLEGPNGKLAELKPSEEAMRDYLAATASKMTTGKWRDHWTKGFKDYYEAKGVMNPAKAWDDTSAVVGLDAPMTPGQENRRLLALEALEVQAYLKRQITGQTTMERKLDSWFVGKVDRLLQSDSPGARAVGHILDRLPASTTAINWARGAVAVHKLLWFPIQQFWVQSSHLAVVAGVSPIHSTAAVRDLIELSYAVAAQGTGARMPKHIADNMEFIRQSGLLTDLHTVDIADMFSRQGRPTEFNTIRGIVKQAGAVPFVAGEGSVRLVAALVAKRELAQAYMNGTLKNLDGTPFKETLNSQAFMKLIVDRSRALSLDMTRAGQLEAFSGLGAAMFQFKQIYPKLMTFYESPKFTGAEKLRAASLMVATFGAPALPFIPDLLASSDYLTWVRSGKPSDREVTQSYLRRNAKMLAEYVSETGLGEKFGLSTDTVDRFLKGGMVSVLSDGEINLIGNVATAGMVQDLAGQIAKGDIMAVVPFLDLVRDYYAFMGKVGIQHSPLMFSFWLNKDNLGTETGTLAKWYAEAIDKPGDVSIIKQYLDGGLTGAQASAKALKEAGQLTPVAGSVARYLEMEYRESLDPEFRSFDPLERNFIQTKAGQTTGLEVTPMRKLVTILGMNPGQLQEITSYERMQQKYKEAYSIYITTKEKEMEFASTPAASHEILKTIVTDLHALNDLTKSLELEGILPKDWQQGVLKKFTIHTIQKNTPVLTPAQKRRGVN